MAALAPLLLAAVCVPALLAFNEPPSPTALNQAAAIAGWGGVLVAAAAGAGPARAAISRAGVLLAALALVAAAAFLSSTLGSLPWALGGSALGLLAATMVLAAGGASLRAPLPLLTAFHAAWVVAGLASALVALVQVFAPQWADGQWIARSGIAGRAVGNLRQPNHLATLLLWSVAALVPLHEACRGSSRARAASVAAWLAAALLLFGVMLSGSRTGLLGVVVLAAWGLLDRRLSGAARALLLATPLLCAAGWILLEWLAAAQSGPAALGAAARVGERDASGGRFSIWRDTLALISQHPWLGVGFGEFNFAWTLTPSAARHPAFFDHTHNLPLQLAAELGLPATLLVLGLLGWALWQAFERSWRAPGTQGVALRTSFVMVLLMALHSQLEYPLWYAYFLLPTALAWGLCLGAGPDAGMARSEPAFDGRWASAAGLAVLAGALAMTADYRKAVVIFSPGDSARPLTARIEQGRGSWFFAHHADYALVTTSDATPAEFGRAPHYLLDSRLMMAWAEALARAGDIDRARHVAARLREFRNANAGAFFAPCDDPAVIDKPFQCQPPSRAWRWSDFTR
jgi:O-antigen ligase